MKEQRRTVKESKLNKVNDYKGSNPTQSSVPVMTFSSFFSFSYGITNGHFYRYLLKSMEKHQIPSNKIEVVNTEKLKNITFITLTQFLDLFLNIDMFKHLRIYYTKFFFLWKPVPRFFLIKDEIEKLFFY